MEIEINGKRVSIKELEGEAMEIAILNEEGKFITREYIDYPDDVIRVSQEDFLDVLLEIKERIKEKARRELEL